MRKFLLLTILPLLTHTLTAQNSDYCIPERFGEQVYFNDDEIEVIENISYGLADNWYNDIEFPPANLFDIAFPKTAIDDLSKRPFIALFAGGGFVTGDKSKLTNFMIEMAKRGYVVAASNYRLGWNTGGVEPSYCLGNPESLVDAYYRATQDIDAAMRYFTYYANDYGIDTSMMFMGGNSAGVMGIMTNVFMSQDNINQLYPGLEIKFGSLNSSTNDIDINYSVKGIINMSGAIANINYIDGNENIPIISFYGRRDHVVPPVSGPIQNCFSSNEYFTVFGSVSIHDRLTDLGFCSVLFTNDITGHDAYTDDFTVPNSACFLRSILCDECLSGKYDNYLSLCGISVPIEETFVEEKILVYPNPVNSLLYLQITEPFGSSIRIVDATGKLMPVQLSGSGLQLVLDVSNYPPGIYFGSFETEESRTEFKFVVNRL